MKTGILVHVYHLEVLGWERLVWGDPARDELGVLTKFADCLLDIPADDEVYPIIYSGPSEKDGLAEGIYTKDFLVRHLDELVRFPRLRSKLERLSGAEHEVFMSRVQGLKHGGVLRNTADEVRNAAAYFTEQGARTVLEIAAASHGPRCVRSQAVIRSQGLIPKTQQWFLAVSDTCFSGGTAADVSIVEPPHRADDPLLGIHPSMPAMLTHFYYDLHGQYRRDALLKIDQVVADVLAIQAKGGAQAENTV